jgi:WD40 repeat protein
MKKFHVVIISFLLSLGLMSTCIYDTQAQPWVVTDVPIMQLSKKNDVGLGEGKIEELQYSPDGRYLAVGWSGVGESGARRIELRDVQSLKIVTTLDIKGFVREMQFSPNGRVLACAIWSESGGEALELWDVQTGQRMKSLPFKGNPGQIGFSPDSVLFFAAAIDQEVKIWEVQTGREVNSPLKELHAGSIGFSPDGRFLAAACWTESRHLIKIWKVGTWKEVNTFEGLYSNSIHFNPDGTLLAAKGETEERGWMKIWEVETGKVVMSAEGDRHYTSLAFSPDGTLLVTGESDSRDRFKRGDPPLEVFIRFWDVQTGKERRALLHGRTSRSTIETQVMGFSPDGKWVASLGEDTDGGVDVKLWDVKTGEILKQLKPDGAWRRNLVAMSPDRRLLASTPDEVTISVLNIATGGKITKQVFDDPRPAIVFSRISPDGKVLATAGESGPIQLWSLETGKHLQTLYQPDRRDLIYTKDGRLLAYTPIRVWDVLTNEELFAALWEEASDMRSIPWPEGFQVGSLESQTVHLSFNELWLAVITLLDFQRRNVAEKGYKPRNHNYKSILKVWNIATGDERTLLNEWEKAIDLVAFSSDWALLAVGFHSGGVEVLEVASSQVIKRFTEYPRIEAVSFHPNGQLLAAIGGGKLFLWEMSSGKRVQTIAGVFQSPYSRDRYYKPLPVFSPDGALIATGSSENSHVVLWDVAMGKQYKLLPVKAESVAFSPDGKLVVTGGEDGTVRVWVR